MIKADLQVKALIAALDGELDHYRAERLRVAIDAAYEKSSCRHIVFDMSKVSFMDSSGIGMLMGRYKMAQSRGGKLVLAGMDKSVSRLFELSGLAKIIRNAETVKAALSELGGGKND